jgi:hypothetical protein
MNESQPHISLTLYRCIQRAFSTNEMNLRRTLAEGGGSAWLTTSIKAGLHHGDYRSKLVPFEEQKYIFYI